MEFILNKPLVSVIIPIYNAELYLRETLESVCNQTYKSLEILLINHHSTKKDISIISSFEDTDNRIKVINLDMNKGGPAYPRNIGIENSTGRYLSFLDADDVWSVDKIEKQIKFMNENNIRFTSSDCSLIDTDSKLLKLSKKSLIFNKFISKKTTCDLIKNNFVITSSVLIHKDLILKFNEDKNIIAVEDFDMWLKIFSKHESEYKYQDKQLLKYRVIEGSASNRSNILRQELKSNIILANFLLNNDKYIWCYFNRLFFHLFRKKLKIIINNMFGQK